MMFSFTGGVVSTEVEKRRWDEDGFLVSLKSIRCLSWLQCLLDTSPSVWNGVYVFCSGNFWCQEHQMKNTSGRYQFIQTGFPLSEHFGTL